MIKSTFRAALSQCGLSVSEAATFLGVRDQKIKDWCSGRVRIPEGVWSEVALLEDQIDQRVHDEFERLKGQPINPLMFKNLTLEVEGAPHGAEQAAGARLLLALVSYDLLD